MPENAPKRDTGIQAVAELISRNLSDLEPGSVLWVADEHPITEQDLAIVGRKPIHFISNRLDQFRLAEHQGFNAQFSDFSFEHLTKKPIQNIFFRVAKERALVHHIINQAFQLLPVGGTLWLIGHKNEGIKTHISRASQLFASKAVVNKGKNQLSVASIKKAQDDGNTLDDSHYSQLRQGAIESKPEIWSKPGAYGWNKIDQGSLFLAEAFKQHCTDLSGKHVLDLGCGYGYLSIFAAQLKPAKIVATDNCAGALDAAAKNLQPAENSDSALVAASDAGDTIEGTFDLILCNPPFHQGFTTSDELHKKFLTNTKRLLSQKGQAWYVVNQFLSLEKHCAQLSLKCSEIARNKSFKVLLIER